jgi:hypothetical protein
MLNPRTPELANATDIDACLRGASEPEARRLASLPSRHLERFYSDRTLSILNFSTQFSEMDKVPLKLQATHSSSQFIKVAATIPDRGAFALNRGRIEPISSPLI